MLSSDVDGVLKHYSLNYTLSSMSGENMVFEEGHNCKEVVLISACVEDVS